MKARALVILSVFICCAAAACSQPIRIVAVDSQHAKPIPDECLNISLGPWHGADLMARTDNDGVVVMTIEKDRVIAETVPGHPCGSSSPTRALPTGELPTVISVLPNYFVTCQFRRVLTKDEDWLTETPSKRLATFSVQEIVTHGVSAINLCSKLKPAAKPGELILVFRKRTVWDSELVP
jgi:hypothetical protein